MKSTTAGFKTIMTSGSARNYVFKVDLTLANNTVLHLTEADIWEDSFCIDTASSSTSTFDIGCAVIGKCSFTINNIEGDFDNYDFFNATATVWLGLEGDVVSDTQQYYRMGFYTVDEPSIANGLISLTLLDNMWKFDRPFSGVNINYPATALTIVQALCSYCGVSLSGTSANFHGKNISISEAPKDVGNMNCREMLQYVVMLGCNFCTINDSGYLEIKWYDTAATASTTDVFEFNQSTSFGTEDIEITGVKFVIDQTPHTIGSAGYVLELENPLVTESNVNTILNSIWDVLDGFTLRTFNLSTASDLAAEIGDKCKIRDYKGGYVYSYITLNTFKTAGHLIQCNAQAPNRQLVTRYSKTVQAAVEEARRVAGEEISNYDLAVQMMNDLAVNAMGGYEEYEDLGTGGRVWYLSNMPITKDPVTGTCSFQPNSTVYKKSGSGFFVSRDGGTTWVNGYNTQTGELVVNVLDAIGINFDWARGGTLTLGGYGNGNGILSILNASNVEKVHGDNTGIIIGSTTGSKMHLTTSGEIDYYYDNAYGGRVRMDAVNYGTQEEPDLRDTFLIDEFNDIEIISDNSKAYMHLSTDSEEDTGNIKIKTEDGDISLTAADQTGEHEFIESTLIVSGEGIHLNGGAIYVSGNQGYDGTQGYPVYVDPQFYTHELEFTNGIVTGFDHNYTSHEVPNSQWHSWQSGGTTYVAIILGVGVTQAVFPDLDSDDSISYEPHIKCASGQSAPKITDMVRTGNSITVTFTAVTQAQAGSGATSECVIKLLRIKG